MEKERRTPEEYYEPYVAEYLRCGSVDQVFALHRYNTGFSYPQFQRVLKEWGIVKSAGPNNHLPNAIYFLTKLSQATTPLETLYAGESSQFKEAVSETTLHRILRLIRNGLTRRHGTALLVTPENSRSQILIGRDVSTPRPELGKPYGSLSLPMTFSKAAEEAHDKIMRVLQQEVLTQLALKRGIPRTLIPHDPCPLFTINIMDVRVEVYHVSLSDSLIPYLYSPKLADLTFVPTITIGQHQSLDSSFRSGVPEIAQEFLHGKQVIRETPLTCLLNQRLVSQLREYPRPIF